MDYIVTFEDGSDGLMHYGVLGMKWGIRHDRERTASKVSSTIKANQAKAAALREKANKKDTTAFGKSKTAKSAKYTAKMAKYNMKAAKAARKAGPYNLKAAAKLAKYQGKAANYERKAQGLAGSVAKAAKYNAKAAKLEFKADKLERAYKKQLNKIDNRTKNSGKTMVSNTFHQNQTRLFNEQVRLANQHAMNNATVEANRAASLSLTGGMNPYMFG